MNQLNIVFAGTPAFGLPCLDALMHSGHRLQAIYTQPDRPAGRGRKIQVSAVKEWALKQQIPVYQPINFKNPEAITELVTLKPDVIVVIAYGLILPKTVLEAPGLGCINVHASLLPRWRGASPIQSAILHGDNQTGITIMQMDAGLDTGAMLRRVICPITASETAHSLHDKLAQIAVQPLLETLEELADHTIRSELQDDNLAAYANKINKKDARINWHQTAIAIDRKIRAFNPWPIAHTLFGEEILRVHQAKVVALQFQQAPGTIVSIDKQGMLIATGHQGLLIEKIQLPGAKVISIADWLNSTKSQGLHTGFCFDES